MASDLDAVRREIELQFAAAWTTAGQSAPIAYANDGFTPPDGPWLRIDILWGTGGWLAMDTGLVVGVIQVTAFVQKGSGSGELTRLADVARDILADQTFGAARTKRPGGPRPGTPEEFWQAAIVDVSFEVQEAA